MVIVDKIIYISKKLAYISKNLEERAWIFHHKNDNCLRICLP
jgi:hypothetical protein